jgi:hypothetical protein
MLKFFLHRLLKETVGMLIFEIAWIAISIHILGSQSRDER